MTRYNFHYLDHNVWSILPLEDKEIINIHSRPELKDNIVTVDSYMQLGSIVLTPEEYDVVSKDPSIDVISERVEPNPEILTNQWVNPIDNPNNFYPNTPSRAEHYPGGIATQNRNFFGYTLSGVLTQPTAFYLGLDNLPIESEVKICLIDEPFSVDDPGHADTKYEAVYENWGVGSTGMHVIQMSSIIAAPGDKMYGIAPNAKLYIGTFYDPLGSMSWGLQNGCKIFNCSYQSGYDPIFEVAVNKVVAQGGIVNIAAGNNGSTIGLINPLCGTKGVTVIGGSRGGMYNDFEDTLRYVSILATRGKVIDFLVPANAMSAGIPPVGTTWTLPSDWYYGSGGTSTSCAVFSGICALAMAKYPTIAGRVLVNLLKQRYSRKVTLSGQEFRLLDFNNLD